MELIFFLHFIINFSTACMRANIGHCPVVPVPCILVGRLALGSGVRVFACMSYLGKAMVIAAIMESCSPTWPPSPWRIDTCKTARIVIQIKTARIVIQVGPHFGETV